MTLNSSRRAFISSTAALAAAAAVPMPAWARGGSLAHAQKGFGELSGEDINLSIGNAHFMTGGRSGHAFAVNGTVPGPLIRLREGQDIRLHVTNNLDEDTSIHALYPDRKFLSAKVRSFVDFMASSCGPTPPWDVGLESAASTRG